MLDFEFNSPSLLPSKECQKTRLSECSLSATPNVIISYQNTTGSVLALFSTPDIVWSWQSHGESAIKEKGRKGVQSPMQPLTGNFLPVTCRPLVSELVL
jgi:hypothetical protein